jgi:hypothetical protein
VGAAFRALFSAAWVLRFDGADVPSAARLGASFRELGAELMEPGKAARHQALFTGFVLLVKEHFPSRWSPAQYALH